MYTRTTEMSSSAWFLVCFVSELRPVLFYSDWHRECKTDDCKVSCARRCVEGYRLLLWQQKDRNKYTNCCSRSFNTARCASVLRIGTSGLNTALAITSHPSSALCSSLTTSLNAVTHLRPSNEAF